MSKDHLPPENGAQYEEQVSGERVIKDATWQWWLFLFYEGFTDLNGYNFDVVEISHRSGGVIYTLASQENNPSRRWKIARINSCKNAGEISIG